MVRTAPRSGLNYRLRTEIHSSPAMTGGSRNVRMLRKKVEKNPANPEYIVSEPWIGYRFRNPEDSESPSFRRSSLPLSTLPLPR
jgi:hypothetical protein